MNEYKQCIEPIPKEHLVYIDESGFEQYYFRDHCYAQKGEIVIGEIAGRKYARESVVAALNNGKLLAPLIYDGTMNYNLFEWWFEYMLIPSTNENSYIILDNASFHRKKKLISICQKHNRKIIFLPPYSPDLNPIEKVWARVKKILRGVINELDTLEETLCHIFRKYYLFA